MIRYSLRCDRDHEFEAWFRSSADYDHASKAGETLCPVCGSHEVGKAPMAPAVSGTKKKGETMSVAVPDPRNATFQAALREFRKKVTEDADYVGDKFAEEARKMHYNEVEARGIYGEATIEEAEALADEGIGFHPLPQLPEDAN